MKKYAITVDAQTGFHTIFTWADTDEQAIQYARKAVYEDMEIFCQIVEVNCIGIA